MLVQVYANKTAVGCNRQFCRSCLSCMLLQQYTNLTISLARYSLVDILNAKLKSLYRNCKRQKNILFSEILTLSHSACSLMPSHRKQIVFISVLSVLCVCVCSHFLFSFCLISSFSRMSEAAAECRRFLLHERPADSAKDSPGQDVCSRQVSSQALSWLKSTLKIFLQYRVCNLFQKQFFTLSLQRCTSSAFSEHTDRGCIQRCRMGEHFSFRLSILFLPGGHISSVKILVTVVLLWNHQWKVTPQPVIQISKITSDNKCIEVNVSIIFFLSL